MDKWEEYYRGLQNPLSRESYDKILNYAINLYKRYSKDSDVSIRGIVLTSIEEQGEAVKSVSDDDFNKLVLDLTEKTK